MDIYTPSNVIVHKTNTYFQSRMVAPPVHLIQYDDKLPVLEVSMYTGDGGSDEYIIPGSAMANIRLGKPDGTVVYNPALGKNSAGNKLYFELTQQMTTCPGKIQATIEIILGEKVACTSIVIFDVERNPVQEGAIESGDEFKSLVEYVEEAQAAAQEIEDMTVSASTGNPGTNVSVEKSGGSGTPYNLHFTIPRGNDGNSGTVASQYSSESTYNKGDYVIYDNNLYICKEDIIIPEAFDSSKWEQTTIGDNLYNKANIDGSYENMSVGNSEQLISSTNIPENGVYSFRPTAGSIDVGDREEINYISGISFGVNQQIGYSTMEAGKTDAGVTFTPSSDGSVTISGTKDSEANTYYDLSEMMVTEAVYYISGANTSNAGAGGTSGGYNLFCRYKNAGVSFAKQYGSEPIIIKPTATGTQVGLWHLQIQVGNASATAQLNDTIKPMCINLTQMFGSTIANYIYSLSIDAALAFIYKYIPYLKHGYLPYNVGKLESTYVNAHRMVGFNLYDATNNRAKLAGGMQYGIYTTLASNQYTVNFTDISGNISTITPDSDGYFEVDVDGTLTLTTSATFDPDEFVVHLVYDGERDDDADIYTEYTYPMSAVELHGMTVLTDAINDPGIAHDIYEPDGTVRKRIKKLTFNGTETWVKVAATVSGMPEYYRYKLGNINTHDYVGPDYVMCAQLSFNTISASNRMYGYCVVNSSANGCILCVRFPKDPVGSSDAERLAWFKSQLAANPLEILTINEDSGAGVITEVVEYHDPYVSFQRCDDWGTEEFIDQKYENNQRLFPIPALSLAKYYPNLKAKLEMAPNSPDDGDGYYVVEQTNNINEYVRLQPLLDRKADIDGIYETFTAGNAEQLNSNIQVEDTDPYIFRTAGGSVDIGNRAYFDGLVGATMYWNQQIQNGDFSNGTTGWSGSNGSASAYHSIAVGSDGWLSLTATANSTRPWGVLTNCEFKQGDIYAIFGYVRRDYDGSDADAKTVVFRGTISGGGTYDIFHIISDLNTAGTVREVGIIVLATSETTRLNIVTGTVTTSTDHRSLISVKNIMVMNLTKMFGNIVANGLQTMEQNVSGSGIAILKGLLEKLNGGLNEFSQPVSGYYKQDTGHYISVKADKHLTTGFNQLYPHPTLNDALEGKLIGGKQYQLSGQAVTIHYTDDWSGIQESLSFDSDGYFIPKNNGTIEILGINELTCVHLVWDGERDGEYEDYISHEYPLDGTKELKGILKLDSSNNIYYDGDIYESDRTITRRYKTYTFTGSESWSYSATYSAFEVSINAGAAKMGSSAVVIDMARMSNGFVQYGKMSAAVPDRTFVYNSNGHTANKIYVKDSGYDSTTINQFAVAMTGVTIIFPLATPTTESADPYASPQVVDDWGTEKFVLEDYEDGTVDVMLPVGHTTRYPANLKAKLEMAPNSPDGDGDYVVRQTSGINEYINYVDSEIGSRLLNLEENKADINGYYVGLTSGQTEQILSSKKSFNKVPYLSRTTGGSADVGARETVKSVMYGSVVHNQLFNIDGTVATSQGTITKSTNKITFTATNKSTYQYINQGIVFPAGHKFLISVDITLSEPEKVGFGDGSSVYLTQNVSANTKTRISFIRNFTEQRTVFYIYPARTAGLEVGETMVVENIIITDLTQYFGSATIPDYLYSLEQSESGSGIAQLHQWGFLRRPYYAYDAGTFKSSNPSFKKNTGRNLFDIVTNYFERKDSSGTSSTVNVTSHGYIRVIPNMTYRLDYEDSSAISDISVAYIKWYDSEYKQISSKSQSNPANAGFNVTAPSNAQYAKLQFYKSGGLQLAPVNTANPCLWIHWDTDFDDDPYVEYKEWTYAIDSTVDGHGIFKLDGNNNLYIDGDTLASDGTNETNFVTETFTACYSVAQSATEKYYAVFNLANTGVDYSTNTIISNGYKYRASVYEGQYYVNSSHKLIVCFTDQTMTTKSAVDTYLASNPLTILYKLATPTTSQKNGFTEIQVCDDWGIQFTNDKAFDDGNSDVEIPVGFESEFPVNLVAKLEMAPESPSDGDGDYIVRQTDGQNEYVKLVNELPPYPSDNGNYILGITINNGTVTKTWVAQA